MDLSKHIRSVQDFPIPGVLFRDVTPLLQDISVLKETINQMEQALSDIEFDYILGPESRGFIFGVPLAMQMNKGFIAARKAGKLPCEVKSKTYSLEYGTATIEIPADALKPGDRVVLVDDLLATGGTARAISELIEEMGAKMSALLFLIELDLGGKAALKEYEVRSLIKY